MEYIRLQLPCIIFLWYIAMIYSQGCRLHKIKQKKKYFDMLIALGFVCVMFDGATAFTVNNIENTGAAINMLLHFGFFVLIDSFAFAFSFYMLYIMDMLPRRKIIRNIMWASFIIAICLVTVFMGELHYVQGMHTNYSMGTSVYICFGFAALYLTMIFATFLYRWNHINARKRSSILTYLIVVSVVISAQFIFPEILITALAVVLMIMGAYMNIEAPSLIELQGYHKETVMSFANLVENRDSNTGGHIKRTSAYVTLLCNELQRIGYHNEIFTNDYKENLEKAAPMHDIGKIAIPDSILQKPARLTEEEFEIIKTHAAKGADIITENFSHFNDADFLDVAYEVARYHHEKWNGKGYPDGLAGEDIPLAARIMAVADVFDAVSEKRCYRDAMPLDECFEIIEKGAGSDFDPVVAQAFLDIRDKVVDVHNRFISEI